MAPIPPVVLSLPVQLEMSFLGSEYRARLYVLKALRQSRKSSPFFHCFFAGGFMQGRTNLGKIYDMGFEKLQSPMNCLT